MVVWLKPCESRSSPGALPRNPQSKRTEGFFFAQALHSAARKRALHPPRVTAQGAGASAPLADRYRCRAVRAVPPRPVARQDPGTKLATQATRSSLGEKGAIHLLAK